MNRRMIILIALAAIVFSIPAGAEINETRGGGGGNGTYPPGWIETPTPAEDASVGEAVTRVRIRGEVVEPASVQTGDIVWNASNFAAFWYDPDGDLMTETLRIISGTLSEYDRTIEEQEIEFDRSEWGTYNVTSFMAETYFTGYSANTSDRITDEPISLFSKGMLSKVLIDEDNKHTISAGVSLELKEGYELKVIQLDVSGDQAQVELWKNEKSVDTAIMRLPGTYVYKKDMGKLDDVPLIAIYVDSVFAGTEGDMLVIKGLFQISEDYICDRTIEKSEIEYATNTMGINFDYSGWGEYDAMSFMAETYFAGYGANTSGRLTGETVSLVPNNMLCKVLIDEDDKHCIPLGTSLELHEGYALKLIQLDINGDKAMIELFRNGKSVDIAIIGNTETYIYTRDLGTVDDVPLIAIHVDSIIACIELDIIVIDGIFQISEDYITVKPGDNYGKMEIVSTSSGAIRMENYDNITLLEGETIDLMGDIHLVVADNGTLRFAPIAELTDPGTYEVRGAVHSQDASQSAAIVWNASNFAAFWYDIDSDASTETLEIAPGTLSELDRTIDEDNLVYATHPIYREYGLYENKGMTVDGHEGYLVEGWVGRQCVAINGRADKICELLVEFEDDDKKTLATGEPWDLGGGFTLTARQIDLGGDKVWFSLYKNGKELDSEIVLSGGVYTYTPDIGVEDEVPVFTCYVDGIYRGTDSNIVQVTYVFLIDDAVLELGTGDRFECMEVVTVSSDEVILRNSETIDLDAGTTRMIMDDVYFKTADDSNLRFYPFAERIIRGAVPPTVGDYIFDSELNVNEGIVIENCINIEVVGVGTGMGNYAKFRISSYQKPTREVTIYQDDIPTKYDTQFGASIYIDVTGVCRNDSVRFRVTGPKNWMVTKYYVVEPVEESILDADDDGVPDVWDMDNSTPLGYWTDSDGRGRIWGDMNGDGKLTSADALILLQAAAENIDIG